jgi:hypothetical protein
VVGTEQPKRVASRERVLSDNESRGASATRSLRKEERDALDQQPLSLLLDSQVLTFREWCRLNRISGRTGRRILASGVGPIVTQLSPKRIGITVGANKRWQQSRERA